MHPEIATPCKNAGPQRSGFTGNGGARREHTRPVSARDLPRDRSVVEGGSLAELAARFGVSVADVRRWVAGGGSLYPRKVIDVERALELYAEGRPSMEVAAILGCGWLPVASVLREAGVMRTPGGPGRRPRSSN